MSVSGIQGQLLEVTVIAGNKLKNTEWLSRQDPYVCVDYGSTKSRTRVCTDGGRNPTFQDKFVFTLIEGLRELSVVVWNSNTITYDDFIGSGKVQLQKVLSQGYDDSSWAILDKRRRHAGEVRLIMHYANVNASKPSKPAYGNHAPSAPLYGGAPTSQAPQCSAPPPLASYPPTSYPPQSPYPPTSSGYPPSPYNNNPQTAYPSFYPPQQPSAYSPQSLAYQPQQSSYPPPPTVYPPPAYLPPPQEQQQYYPPGSHLSAPYPPRQY